MLLNAMQIANAKPKERPYKVSDGDGLFLQVNPNGSRWWRFRYIIHGKEKMISFGTYPEVSLADARDRRWEARKLVSNGTDPSQIKQDQKREAKLAAANTFRAVTEEWHAKYLDMWTPEYGAKILRWLEKHVFPDFGNRPISEIKPIELLTLLQKIEKRDTTEILRRVPLAKQTLAIFRRLKELNGDDLQGYVLPSQNRQKNPIMCENTINNMLKKMGYKGQMVGHGFRSLASTTLNEEGQFKPDVIERQLAHKEMNKVRAAYILPFYLKYL